MIFETVSCLECGDVYAKRSDGGTALSNPGCPACGYVGWRPISVPIASAFSRGRGADDRQRRRAQSG